MTEFCLLIGACFIAFGLFYFILNCFTRIASGTSVHDRLAACCEAHRNGDYDYKILCHHFESYAVRDFMTRACFKELNAQLADGRMAPWNLAPRKTHRMDFLDFVCQYHHPKFEAYCKQPQDNGSNFNLQSKIYGVVGNRRILLTNIDTFYALVMDFIIRDNDFESIAKVIRRLRSKGYDDIVIPVMEIYEEASKPLLKRIWDFF